MVGVVFKIIAISVALTGLANAGDSDAEEWNPITCGPTHPACPYRTTCYGYAYRCNGFKRAECARWDFDAGKAIAEPDKACGNGGQCTKRDFSNPSTPGSEKCINGAADHNGWPRQKIDGGDTVGHCRPYAGANGAAYTNDCKTRNPDGTAGDPYMQYTCSIKLDGGCIPLYGYCYDNSNCCEDPPAVCNQKCDMSSEGVAPRCNDVVHSTQIPATDDQGVLLKNDDGTSQMTCPYYTYYCMENPIEFQRARYPGVCKGKARNPKDVTGLQPAYCSDPGTFTTECPHHDYSKVQGPGKCVSTGGSGSGISKRSHQRRRQLKRALMPSM